MWGGCYVTDLRKMAFSTLLNQGGCCSTPAAARERNQAGYIYRTHPVYIEHDNYIDALKIERSPNQSYISLLSSWFGSSFLLNLPNG